MANQTIVKEQNRTKEGILVVPLDEVRTIDYNNITFVSGATAANLYTVASGKEVYLRQLWITELSGNAGSFQIADAAGNPATPPIKLAGGQDTRINTVLGPFTSGLTIVSGSPINASITAVVQIDPKVNE